MLPILLYPIENELRTRECQAGRRWLAHGVGDGYAGIDVEALAVGARNHVDLGIVVTKPKRHDQALVTINERWRRARHAVERRRRPRRLLLRELVVRRKIGVVEDENPHAQSVARREGHEQARTVARERGREQRRLLQAVSRAEVESVARPRKVNSVGRFPNTRPGEDDTVIAERGEPRPLGSSTVVQRDLVTET